MLDLAKVLETTVDHILNGGQRMMEYTRRVSVAQIREGIECFVHIGELLGKDNLFYIGAMEGIDQKMNMEFEKYLADPYTREAMIAEALVQNIAGGAYVDLSDVQRSFQHPHWVKTVCEYAQKYGLE